MKKSIILLLILFLISISVEAQQPIPITSLARSSNPLMTIQTNANRYQSYQYFTTAWGDTLLNFMQANPNWLGTYLPAGAVNIAAAGNNLQFTQGGTFRWTSDTTSLGEWIPQFTVSPLLSGGLINQRLIGVGSLANKYIGTSGQDNLGLYVDGYPDIYLRNQQIQDTSLAAGNYYPRVDEEGKVEFGQSGIFDAINSNSPTIPQQMYAKTLDPDLDPQLYFGYFPSFPDLNLRTEKNNGFYLSPFYWGSNGIVNSDGNGNFSDISGYNAGAYMSGGNRSIGFFTTRNEGGFSYNAAVSSLYNRDTVTSNPVYNSLKQYTYYNAGAGSYIMGNIFKISDHNEAKDYYMGFGKSNTIGFYDRSNTDNYTFQGANYGFVIQSRSTATDTFNFFRVDVESISENAIEFYNKYRFSNSQPVTTNNVKSLHTWTGDGSTTTPAMETMPFLFQYASFEVTGTNDTYTGQEPIHGWNQIGTSGVTGNITIQGDTMFQFPTTGVYEVEFNLVLYSLATQSDFTLSINNVTDLTGYGTGSMEGQTQLNGGLEFTVKYILTATSSSAQFTQDLLGTGVGTIVRTGSRCNIKRLY